MYKVIYKKIKFFLTGFFILGIMIIPHISFSESQIQIQGEEIVVETIPENPQPYENVTIIISSYATDLNKAIITWQNESETILSGIGKKSYSFKTGGPDTVNVFNINIVPVGSMNIINKTIYVIPSEVEILWESVDGYAPPFYKGKILPVSGGLIKAIAIPNTSTIKNGIGSISYTWKNSDNTSLEDSGYNKNSYIFKNSALDDQNKITVLASSINGDYSAENTIEIPIYDPKIVFYKKSPTEGILYGQALNKETFMTENEMTIVAEPYFISLKNKEGNFSYKWQINNESIKTPAKKTEITIRPTSRDGYATINLLIENTKELFQEASNRLKINL